MIPLLLTIAIFPLVGYAAAALFRLSQPATLPGRIGMFFLTGVGINGTLLYLIAVLGVPLYRPIFAVMPIAALIITLWRGRLLSLGDLRLAKGTLFPNVVLAIPLIAMFFAAAIFPIRDYDGRVTWLPKARAIVFDGSVDGPFFQGQAGLNLHNHYPLLLPLNAATVMQLSGTTEGESAGWLYVLIAIASLLAARDLLVHLFGATCAWVIALAAWLPALTALEGGALSAYSDLTVAGFAGVAMLLLMSAGRDGSAVRTAGILLAALVLTKNEGVVLAAAILTGAALTRAVRTPRQWLVCTIPPFAALILLELWRAGVPAAYDEQYTVLFRELPQSIDRIPAALRAMVRHACDPAEWGWFWPATATASLALISRRMRPLVIMPLAVLAFMLAMYLATFTVTSWNVDELASVAARRLLSQLIIPACCVLAAAACAIAGHNDESFDRSTLQPAPGLLDAVLPY